MSRRLQGGLGLALFLAIGLSWLVLPGGDGGGLDGSVQNRGPRGRRAALALLAELGFEVSAWSQVPGALGPGEGLVWMPGPPVLRRVGDGPSQAVAGDLHDPRHYRDFCERGGCLVLPWAGAGEFLVRDLGLGDLAGLDQALEARGRLRRLSPFAAPELDVLLDDTSIFVPTLVPEPCEPILVAPDGVAGVELLVGRGRVVVLADDGFLDNDRIAHADHALLTVRLAEELARGGPLRFDEYALGAWRPPTTSQLVLGPRLLLLSANVLALLAVFTWRHAWVRGFPRDPEALAVLSPLSRARASAALVERAHRLDLLGTQLVEGVLGRLAARLRVGGPPGAEGGADASALLESVAARAGLVAELPAWRQALFGRPVRRAADLERLERTLESIEKSVLDARRGGAPAHPPSAEKGPPKR